MTIIGSPQKGQVAMNNGKQMARRETDSLDANMARAAGSGQLGNGQALVRVGGAYQTAMAVQVKRDIGSVENPGGAVLQRALVEASLLGDRYAYGWEVNDRASGGKKAIEGVSVDGAYMLLRAWGNAVCDVDLVDTNDEAYTFKATLVDLESGATCSRLYRQHRSEPPGKYDKQRWDDMAFSNGQSRAVRNVICAALPQWLQDRCMDAASRAADREERRGPAHAAPALSESTQLAEKFEAALRASWGKDDLVKVGAEIQREQHMMRSSDVARLREIYKKQLAAWEQGGAPSQPHDPRRVPDAEFEDGPTS